MICYKDRSFCSSKTCVNTKCSRLLSEEVRAGAEKWWGGPDAPIATIDFSFNCPDYIDRGL